MAVRDGSAGAEEPGKAEAAPTTYKHIHIMHIITASAGVSTVVRGHKGLVNHVRGPGSFQYNFLVER